MNKTDMLCSDLISSRHSKRMTESRISNVKEILLRSPKEGKLFKYNAGSYNCRIVDVEALKRAGLYNKFTRSITRNFLTVSKKKK